MFRCYHVGVNLFFSLLISSVIKAGLMHEIVVCCLLLFQPLLVKLAMQTYLIRNFMYNRYTLYHTFNLPGTRYCFLQVVFGYYQQRRHVCERDNKRVLLCDICNVRTLYSKI